MRKKEIRTLNALGYHEYRLKLSSDKGKHYITTVARNENEAIHSVCVSENCPKNAILKIWEIN